MNRRQPPRSRNLGAVISHYTSSTKLRVWILALLGSIAVSGVLVAMSDNPLPFDRLNALDYGWLAFSTACLFASIGLGAIRLLIALRGQRTSLPDALEINAVQQIAVRLLPVRLSEVVWGVMVSRLFKISASRILAIFVTLRMWDLRILLSALFISGPFVLVNSSTSSQLSAVLIITGLGLITLVLLPTRGFIHFCDLCSRWMRYRATLRTARLFSLRTLRQFREVNKIAPLLQGTAAAFGWLLALSSLGAILVSLGLTLSYSEFIVILLSMLFASAIPLPALGVVGPAEFGLVAGLVSAGLPVSEASEITLALALIHSLMSYLTGALIWFGRRLYVLII